MLLLAASTAASPWTFLALFTAQALSWMGVPALGAAAGAAGALAHQGTVELWAVLVVGTAGAEVGSLGGWWIGYRVARAGLGPDDAAPDSNASGKPLNDRRRKALAAGEKVARRWGRLMVFFVPSWVPGALGMPIRQFAFWNFFAALGWNIGAALTAYGIASAAYGDAALHFLVPLAIGLVTLAAIFVVLRSAWRHERKHHEDAIPGAHA